MTSVRNFFRGVMLDARDAREVDEVVGNHARWIELLRGGRIAGRVGGTAAPTGGTWKQGDFFVNTTPTELGTSPNKYVIIGWSCVADGTPGTWVQCRCLTGN